MNLYSKTVLLMLFALLCTSCGQKSSIYEDEYVSFVIPDGVEVENVQSSFLTGVNYSKPGHYSLTIYEIPVGLASIESPIFLQALGCPWLADAELNYGEIDGYPVKVYNSVMKGNYDIYTDTYVFSNGDKSVVLVESQKDEPGKWWKENLRWNIPQRSDLSLEQRTQNLAEFLNGAIKQLDGKLQITSDSNTKTVEIKVVADVEQGYSITEDAASPEDEWRLLSCFDVIDEYAAQQFDFAFTLSDTNGEDLYQINFPYSEYSQWESA